MITIKIKKNTKAKVADLCTRASPHLISRCPAGNPSKTQDACGTGTPQLRSRPPSSALDKERPRRAAPRRVWEPSRSALRRRRSPHTPRPPPAGGAKPARAASRFFPAPRSCPARDLRRHLRIRRRCVLVVPTRSAPPRRCLRLLPHARGPAARTLSGRDRHHCRRRVRSARGPAG